MHIGFGTVQTMCSLEKHEEKNLKNSKRIVFNMFHLQEFNILLK